MLTIRLQRVGRKHDPVFRVVVTDSKTGPKSNKHKEIIGSYDARRETRAIIDTEKATYWLAQGAQPSDTVRNALVDLKVINGKKVNALPKKSPIVDEAKIAAEKAAEEAEKVAKAKAAEEKVAAEEAAKAEAEAPKEEVAEEAPAEEEKEEVSVAEEKTEDAPVEEKKEEASTEEIPEVTEEKTEETPAEEIETPAEEEKKEEATA